MTCPSCSSELPSPKFKFCPFCGSATTVENKTAKEPTRSAPKGAADTIAEPNRTESTRTVSSEGPATLFGRPPGRVLASDTLPEPAPAIRTTDGSNAPPRASSRVGNAKAAPAKAGKAERTASTPGSSTPGSSTPGSSTPGSSTPGSATIVDPPHARPDSEAATVFELPAIDAATLEEAVQTKRQGSKAGMSAPVRTDEINSAILEGAIRAAPRSREDDRPTVLNLAAVTGFDETRDHPAVSAAKASSVRSSTPVSSPAAATPGASSVERRAASAPSRSTTARPASAPKSNVPKTDPVGPSTSPKVGVPEPATPTSDRKKFSETAWFMAAVNPADLAEREGAAQGLSEAEDMTERYAVDEPLPDEVRSKFSLRGLLGRSPKKKS